MDCSKGKVFVPLAPDVYEPDTGFCTRSETLSSDLGISQFTDMVPVQFKKNNKKPGGIYAEF